MMALKLLPILQVVVILCSPSHSYPTVYGTKSQNYPTPAEEYYYEPMSYPVYYPRTSKYEVYQAVLPYYYDRPMVHSGLGYYGYDDATDPMVDIEEEMLHDAERKQREDSQAIGQETYFEEDDLNPSAPDNYNDVNAAFLNNLIMSQMYKDSFDNKGAGGYHEYEDEDESDDEIYGKVDEFPPNHKPSYYNEDEEVLELKNLAGGGNKAKQLKPDERLRWFQKGANKKHHDNYADDDEYSEKKRSVDGRLEWFTDRVDRKATMKPTVAPPTTTSTATVSAARKIQRGQKEEVLPRPAKPVKHPFAVPVLNNVYKKDRPRQPSVYDTIKHMLDMEKSLEKHENVVKPAMRKRIISTEDSLTRQLSVLKKHD